MATVWENAVPVLMPCDGCHATLSIPDSKIGQPVTCPRCGASVVATGPPSGEDVGDFIPGDDEFPEPPPPSHEPQFSSFIPQVPVMLPWFYGFLRFFAHLVMFLGSLGVWIYCALSLATMLPNAPNNDSFLKAVAIGGWVLYGVWLQVLVLVIPALVLLFCDIGEMIHRNR